MMFWRWKQTNTHTDTFFLTIDLIELGTRLKGNISQYLTLPLYILFYYIFCPDSFQFYMRTRNIYLIQINELCPKALTW